MEAIGEERESMIHGSWQGLSFLSYFIAFAGERDTAQHAQARQRVKGSHRVFVKTDKLLRWCS